MYRPKRRGRLLLLVFLALSILVITLDFRGGSGGPLERAKEITEAIVAPIQRGLTAITRPIGNFFSAIGDLADLREENKKLEDEVAGLQSEITEARDMAEENAELRELLELDESWATMDRVVAEVIADAPANYRWAIRVDAGTSDGVKKDMAVITADGLAGKVVSVGPNDSTILLLVDPTLGGGATTEQRRLTGVVSGNGFGEDLAMEFVSKQETIRVGDRVITSTYNQGIFPPGIPVGFVSAIGGDARAAEFEIQVNPFVDFARIDHVVIRLETGDRVDEDVSGG